MSDDAVQQLREKLIAGEWTAIQFVLERVLPRGRMLEFEDSTPSAIASAMANGELTTEEAKNVAIVLEKLVRLEEVEELRNRIEALESLADDR